MARRYPRLSDIGMPCRPLSIVCVRFSGDFLHNFAKSECIRNSANQIIVVDNRSNAHYANLGEAMNAGIRQALHPIVVIAHEDVLFPDNWQQHFERALRQVEASDPNWGLLGAGGWLKNRRFLGHLSDPFGYVDTLGSAVFHPIDWLDEQLLVLKNDGVILPDPDLPGIHNIGRDLAGAARQHGRVTYVINAPTIHKYADAEGKIIRSTRDSPKIMDRRELSYKADEACSLEYFDRKWYGAQTGEAPPPKLTPKHEAILERPLILVARGGGGSRLLSMIAKDFRLFIGSRVNDFGDAIEMVMPIYMGVIRKFSCKAEWQKQEIIPHLRQGAARMLRKAWWPEFWGFKLPESIYLLSEINEAFPHARFLHLLRDPLATSLGRAHITGRLDHQIGRIVIPPGYDHAHRARSLIHTDSTPMHMAVTTVHQLDLALAQLPADRTHAIRFENILDAPDKVTEDVSDWLHKKRSGDSLAAKVDVDRAENPGVKYPSEVATEVREFLLPLRRRLHYVAE